MQIYLDSSNWREILMRGLYDMAGKRNKVIRAKLGLHEFEYALINPKDGYARDRVSKTGEYYEYQGKIVTDEIKESEKILSIGENIPGCAFVFERVAPVRFHHYIGLHEYAESSGNEHIAACKTELDEVIKDPLLFQEYSAFLIGLAQETIRRKKRGMDINGYFDRAIPDFLDFIKKGTHNPTELVMEFKRQIDRIVQPLSQLKLMPQEGKP